MLRTPGPISSGRAVLVVAHPGHELSLAGWLAMMRPSVFVITDGSGQLGRSRLHSTTKVLLRTGARPGSIYGHLSDQEVYDAMLRQDVGLFLRIAYDLTDWLVLHGIEYVVGDSAEGYNPTHDVCRILVGGAVELAHREIRMGRRAPPRRAQDRSRPARGGGARSAGRRSIG